MKKLIIFPTIFLILACFCLTLVPVQAEQEPLWSYKGAGMVEAVAITPDGNYIAAGSGNYNVYIIDKQGKKIGSYNIGGTVESVAITPDGNYIAAAGGWDNNRLYFFTR